MICIYFVSMWYLVFCLLYGTPQISHYVVILSEENEKLLHLIQWVWHIKPFLSHVYIPKDNYNQIDNPSSILKPQIILHNILQHLDVISLYMMIIIVGRALEGVVRDTCSQVTSSNMAQKRNEFDVSEMKKQANVTSASRSAFSYSLLHFNFSSLFIFIHVQRS